MSRVRVVAVVSSAAALIAGVAIAPGQVGASSSAALPGSAPAWLTHARLLGRPASSLAVTARVYLAPRGGLAALEDEAAAVSTPGSAGYRQFLTPAQYHARFDPSAQTVRAVRGWLADRGLHVTAVGADNAYVDVASTVHTAERAFHTTIRRYQHDGQTVQAPDSALAVPAALGAAVLTVTGLDTTTSTMTPASAQFRTAAPATSPYPPGFRTAGPCSTWFGRVPATTEADGRTPLPLFRGKRLSYAPCGYLGVQLRPAYEGNTTLTGAGVTVAIIDAYASPSIATDVSTYANAHKDGAWASGQLTQVTPLLFSQRGPCNALGWYGEETLDIEAVHALAPRANVRYYGAASCTDSSLLGALTKVVNDGKASIVSNSWGGVESNETAGSTRAFHAVFLQGATEGMSFVFSSGDNGDERASSGRKQVDYPASDSAVTAVGGTSTEIAHNASIASQTGWGTVKYALHGHGFASVGFLYGAGGGGSALFAKPSYQAGVPGSTRQVPDVAMDADPNTGMLIGETQSFPAGNAYGEYRVGGTSLAAPLFTAMTALAEQHSRHRAGQLNPAIYRHASAFTDVSGPAPDLGVVRADYVNQVDARNGMVYTARTFDQDSSLPVGRGWDPVTGLGVPNGRWFTALG